MFASTSKRRAAPGPASSSTATDAFNGEARYGDWIERLFYNGVGAMIPMNDYGMIMYGSSYNIYAREVAQHGMVLLPGIPASDGDRLS